MASCRRRFKRQIQRFMDVRFLEVEFLCQDNDRRVTLEKDTKAFRSMDIPPKEITLTWKYLLSFSKGGFSQMKEFAPPVGKSFHLRVSPL